MGKVRRHTTRGAKAMTSQTDWARVAMDQGVNAPAAVDADDTRATPQELGAALRRARGQRGPQKAPVKRVISIRLDQEVVDYFRGFGRGWQSRINDFLRLGVVGHNDALEFSNQASKITPRRAKVANKKASGASAHKSKVDSTRAGRG